MAQKIVNFVAMTLVAMVAGTAQAGVLLVAGSPTYDPATSTGLKGGTGAYTPGSPSSGVNNSGTAVGFAGKYVSGTSKGYRAVRWDSSGTTATELGNSLGTDFSGTTGDFANALNDVGTAVGETYTQVYGISLGYRAVRWDASGTAATVLGNLGSDSDGRADANAYAINAAGTAVGYAKKYVSGSDKGYRAVRWGASGTAATELANLGTDSDGYTWAEACAVNTAGTTVGYARKYISGSDKGYRAVRWGASGTVATELGTLGENGSGDTDAQAYAVNDAGTAVGYSDKYVSGSYGGNRAVRWSTSGTVATELANLGTSSSGTTDAQAYAINAAGTAVGYAYKYVSGVSVGQRAVRWDASGTAATELGNMGINSSGYTNTLAVAVNAAGTAVGYGDKYVGGTYIGSRAAIWLPDASVIDLNDLGVIPVSGGGTWKALARAKALSADGWVSGDGSFDPDGDGALASYTRLWVAQVGLGGTWTSAAGGTWGRGPNWSTGTPAMQVGNATFNLDSTYTVTLDRDELTKTIAVNDGTVTIDFGGHTLTTENGLNVANGATLKGAGTIVSDIINAGTITPGNSPATLNLTGNLVNTGTLEFEIASLLSHDEINLTGAFTAGGTIVVKLLDGYTPIKGDIFDLMDFASFVNNGYTFDWSHTTLSAGLAWDTAAFATTGSIDVVGVPEPSAIILLCIGGVSLLVYAWRRQMRTV